jgi:hypothetical protein
MSILSDPVLDPFAPTLVHDPYPTYARLLDTDPWQHDPTGYWVVSRHAEVRTVVFDPRFTRSDFRARAYGTLGDGPLARSLELWMLFRDPPDHTRLRRLIGAAFTPQAVHRLRRQIEASVEALLEQVAGHATFDAIADLAYPLPVVVIGALLGVPTGDRVHFRNWSVALADGMESTVTPRPDAIARGNGAVEEMSTYLRGLIAERRRLPRADLLSELIEVRDGGDRLTEDELVATSLLLFFAGHETTVNLIGNGLHALLRHPTQRSILQSEPSLFGSAIDELLRFDSPVQRTFRVTEEAVELSGTRIERGERVMALIGAANRDPRRFSQPDVFDVRRSDAKHHLSFGGGIHYCIGAPLARLEAEIVLRTLLERFPDLHLVEEAVQWRANLIFRGLQRLVVAGARA